MEVQLTLNVCAVLLAMVSGSCDALGTVLLFTSWTNSSTLRSGITQRRSEILSRAHRESPGSLRLQLTGY